ncbi:hypothetical protein NS506_06465 [Nocardia seriolae]|uniref:Uncharacterized protein n=1 Tax=Nocardia seriolae TaxID=37332 RepID=A0ABC8B1M3_9NOCA|nr:hypothetical protein [Nocardia seriolae]APB00501.1 hypothetical protein NS506_06465 [Nocardia seriolae]
MVWVSASTFGVAWWLGLYLLARDPRKPLLRRAASGLLVCAAAVVADRLAGGEPWFDGVRIVLVCAPVLAFSGVFVRLLPVRAVERVDRLWRVGLLPLCALLAMPAVGGFLPAGYLLGALTLLALLGTMLGMLGQHAEWSEDARRSASGLLTVGALLLGLSAALILLGLNVLPRTAMLSVLAADLVVLGLGIAVLDAFDEGESLRAAMIHSLVVSAATAAVFGGQAALALALAGERPALVALFFGAIAAAITLQVLNAPLQASADRLAFASDPQLCAARGELRSATDALLRKSGDTLLHDNGETGLPTTTG